jgi:exonuclease VII large subunit
VSTKRRAPIPADAADLIARLAQASLTETFATSNRLVEHLTSQLDEAQAMIAAIRTGVADLLEGDYMPTPAAIERALWPSDWVVARFKEGDS